MRHEPLISGWFSRRGRFVLKKSPLKQGEFRSALGEAKGISVQLKWHTLALAGLLGLLAPWKAAFADDYTSGAWQTAPAADGSAARKSLARANSTPTYDNGPQNINAAERRLTQELLRQAMVELDANHFETARRLTRRAAAVGVNAGFAGIRPEQVFVEIDRKERASQSVIPAVSEDSGRRFKAHAIELLDHGLLALDEKRFDEAEQCARQAAELHVPWEKYDYRPENLLTDIRRERSSLATGQAIQPAAASAIEPRPLAAGTHPPTEWANRTSAPATAPDSGAARSPAETLLQQAMDDLRAGRDELARQRLEQALGSLPGSQQSVAVASFGGSATTASNRPAGFSAAATPPGSPAYVPPSPSSVYFPVRRDQPNLAPTFQNGAEVAIKPLHDPYLGDEPTTTDKSGPGGQAMRESLPIAAPVNPVYVSRNGAPTMTDAPVQRVTYDSASPQYAPSSPPPKIQTSPDVPSLNPQISWLEKMSTPIPAQGMPPQGMAPGMPTQGASSPPFHPLPPNGQAMAAERGFNPAPIAPPASTDTQWSAGRMSTPTGADPAVANSPDQPKPGFFQKVWGAISGE